jgi:glucose/arabinose dehydrogenase
VEVIVRHARLRTLSTRTTLALLALFAACSERIAAPELELANSSASADQTRGRDDDGANAGERRRGRLRCDADNGGITLPAGFCAVVVADGLGAARHMVVTPDGDVFVAINQTRNSVPPFGIVALRDENGDGRADVVRRFNAGRGGSGIDWRDGRLYFGENDRIVRYRLRSGDLQPRGGAEIVVDGLPSTGDHISKTVVLRDERTLFVNIGSASNACQVANRVAQSPGVLPCPELPVRAGVWTFDALGTGQTQASGRRYATGYRNMVALAVQPRTGELYGVMHGRDMLFENWPQFFTQEDDAVLPAEEFLRIRRGSDAGWPYCFFDAVSRHRKVLAPEYGGDGEKVAGTQGIDCSAFNQPLATFGAHWAPNGMHFYQGRQFPRRFRDGAFVAFHGGFDRAPLPNEGYKVMFVPMTRDGRVAGAAEVFADDFAASAGPLPATAVHRPVGVTEGPDGSLYISDDKGGRIWRVVYVGRRDGGDDDEDDDRHDGDEHDDDRH